jgi:FlgD Ig-like domain
MKRLIALALTILMLFVPAMLVAKDAGNRDVFRVGKAEFSSPTEFTVSLQVTHDEDLAAMDIPLSFSKGVTLNSVTFEGTAVKDFDVQIAGIDNEKNRVVIGLLGMVYSLKENANLKPAVNGSNTVAVLHFTLNDENLKTLEIAPFSDVNPSHELMYVYNEWINDVPNVQSLSPDFQGGSVALDSRTPAVNLPAEFALSQNVPNPFNPTTIVAYDLPKDAQVNLDIYNVLGQHVKTLVNEMQRAGRQTVTWDGTDNSGSSVASGVYFYKLRAGDFTDTKKMVMLK